MKIRILALLILSFVPLSLMAQRGLQKRLITAQEADSLRVQVITRELRLSSAESSKFWPVYNEYLSDLKILNKSYYKRVGFFTKNINALNDQQLNEFVSADLDFQQQKLDLKKKYDHIFRGILPIRKLANFYIAQESFGRQLIQYRISKGLGN